MNQKYGLDEKSWEKARAALLLAKKFGLIEDAGIPALERRLKKRGSCFTVPAFIRLRCICNMS